MLLVVVDQARIRRRGDDAVTAGQLDVARVAMQHLSGTPARAEPRELLDPRHGVQAVAAEELRRRLHRPARALVLVAPVFADLRLAREVEVEMRRAPGRTRRPRKHDPEHVRMLVVGDHRLEIE